MKNTWMSSWYQAATGRQVSTRHLVVSEQQSGEDWHYRTHTHTQSAEYDVRNNNNNNND